MTKRKPRDVNARTVVTTAKRVQLLQALADMPDEAFGWFVLATAPSAMLHGANAQIWPDGIGGFMQASKVAITEIRAAADAYLKEAK